MNTDYNDRSKHNSPNCVPEDYGMLGWNGQRRGGLVLAGMRREREDGPLSEGYIYARRSRTGSQSGEAFLSGQPMTARICDDAVNGPPITVRVCDDAVTVRRASWFRICIL